MYQPITYSLLKSKHACPEQLELIETYFGKIKPVPLTKKVAIKFSGIFNIDWTANHLLTNEDLVEYEKVIVPAYAEFEKVAVPAMEKYGQVNKPDWSEYWRVIDPALKKFNKSKALTFIEIYKSNLTT